MARRARRLERDLAHDDPPAAFHIAAGVRAVYGAVASDLPPAPAAGPDR